MGGKKDKKNKGAAKQEQIDEGQPEQTQTKPESITTTQDNTVVEDSAQKDDSVSPSHSTPQDIEQPKVEPEVVKVAPVVEAQPVHQPVETHAHPEPTKDEAPAKPQEHKHEEKAEPKADHQEPQVETHAPAPIETVAPVEVHATPEKKEDKQEEPLKPTHVEPVQVHQPAPVHTEPVHVEPVIVEPIHTEPVHEEPVQVDTTSSFVKIGDSLPPQPETQSQEVHASVETLENVPAHKDTHSDDKAPVDAAHALEPVNLSDPKYKSGEWDQSLHHGVPIGGSTQNPYKETDGDAKEAHHDAPVDQHLHVEHPKADITHSPIPHPPIPDPPIVQPPAEVHLGNDQVHVTRDDKIEGHHADRHADKQDGGSTSIWLYGAAAVAVAALAFMKWKKVF